MVASRTFFGTRAQDRFVRAARLHGNNDIRCVNGSSTLRLALLYRNMQNKFAMEMIQMNHEEESLI